MSESRIHRNNDGDVEVLQRYREILATNGITEEISKVVLHKSDSKGDGMLSETHPVTLTFSISSDKKDLNLFAKVHTQNPSHSKVLEELRAFEKESCFLTKYIPAAKEFCRSRGVDVFVDLYPKCYFADKDFILLENLKLERGFVMTKLEDMQDLEQAELGVKVLSKHGALSYCFIKSCGGVEQFFNKFPILNHDGRQRPLFAEIAGPVVNNGLTADIKILERNPVEGSTDALAKLRDMQSSGVTMMLESIKLKEKNEGFRVLNHGDFWNNNMMFKKDPTTGNITDCAIIDFQMVNYNVPALDLSYYFFSSLKSEVRKTYTPHLLKLYLETFKKIVADFGYHVDVTNEEFADQYRRKFAFGYFWGGIALSCGPGTAVLKDIDMNQVDMKDWARLYGELIAQWIDNHPEEGKRMAVEIVNFVKEFDQIMNYNLI